MAMPPSPPRRDDPPRRGADFWVALAALAVLNVWLWGVVGAGLHDLLAGMWRKP